MVLVVLVVLSLLPHAVVQLLQLWGPMVTDVAAGHTASTPAAAAAAAATAAVCGSLHGVSTPGVALALCWRHGHATSPSAACPPPCALAAGATSGRRMGCPPRCCHHMAALPPPAAPATTPPRPTWRAPTCRPRGRTPPRAAALRPPSSYLPRRRRCRRWGPGSPVLGGPWHLRFSLGDLPSPCLLTSSSPPPPLPMCPIGHSPLPPVT